MILAYLRRPSAGALALLAVLATSAQAFDRPITHMVVPSQTHDKPHRGHPGDPVNVLMVGRPERVEACILKAGWIEADAVTLRSTLKLGRAIARHHDYPTAPVSPLYLFGRKQDLAFEKHSENPNHRDHLRVWRSALHDRTGRPFWAVAVTKDVRIGFKRTNHMPTHHIAPDVDAEQRMIVADLKDAGCVSDAYAIQGMHPGTYYNGGGDPFTTRGKVQVVLLK